MHPPVKKGLQAALSEVFNDKKYSDKALEAVFKANRQFGSRDRRQLAEALYFCVRHWRRLCHLTQLDENKSCFTPKDFDAVLELYLGSDLDSAKPNLMPKAHWYSVCDEFYETLVKELGEQKSVELLEAMNVHAPVFLRTNTLKIPRDRLVSQLTTEGFSVEDLPESSVAVRLLERKNVFASSAFQKGYFEVQDLGSQKIAPALGPVAGERVIDACAGAGGKSLHMAALMGNKGRIISMDIHQWKLDELRRRCRRAGVDIVEARLIDSAKTIKRLHQTADRVLLDVPCTGSGVLRRNPDTKLRFSQEDHLRLQKLQFDILSNYSKMVKPGGVLVYSTCSVLPSENQKQIERFLSENATDWKLDSSTVIDPTPTGPDGFFISVLKCVN